MPQIWLGQRPQGAEAAANGCAAIELDLEIFDETLRARLSVPDGPLRLPDLVPAARAVSDEMVRRAAGQAALQGRAIPCRRGCSACCRYLVPLSVPEALRLWEEIHALPQGPRGRAARGFEIAARRIRQVGPPKLPSTEPADGLDQKTAALEAVSAWYTSLNLPCPFLAGDTCTFYDNRPITCREHVVVSPRQHCLLGSPAATELLATPVSLTDVLARLTAEVEQTPLEAVLLPIGLHWHQANRHRAERTWPARMLLERFVELLQEMAARQSEEEAA